MRIDDVLSRLARMRRARLLFTTVGQVRDGHQIGENLVPVTELAACLNYYSSSLSVEAAS